MLSADNNFCLITCILPHGNFICLPAGICLLVGIRSPGSTSSASRQAYASRQASVHRGPHILPPGRQPILRELHLLPGRHQASSRHLITRQYAVSGRLWMPNTLVKVPNDQVLSLYRCLSPITINNYICLPARNMSCFPASNIICLPAGICLLAGIRTHWNAICLPAGICLLAAIRSPGNPICLPAGIRLHENSICLPAGIRSHSNLQSLEDCGRPTL